MYMPHKCNKMIKEKEKEKEKEKRTYVTSPLLILNTNPLMLLPILPLMLWRAILDKLTLATQRTHNLSPSTTAF